MLFRIFVKLKSKYKKRLMLRSGRKSPEQSSKANNKFKRRSGKVKVQ